MNLLITGGSGFIGKALLARLLFERQYDQIFLLIRPTYRHSSDQRVDELIEQLLPPELREKGREKIKAISGDLTQNRLGLSQEAMEFLVENTDQILHVGASTDLSAPIEVARSINLEGTRRVLDLASDCHAAGRLKRLEYISTAFVAGIQWGQVYEKDLVRAQSFANAYEQSKYECEILLREYQKSFPITIYRPSVVVGDSTNGYTTHFKVLYWPIKILAKRIKGCVTPMSLFARVDMVPVDYVADGICALMKDPTTLYQTYHLTAGRGNEQWILRVAKDAAKALNVKKYPVMPVLVYKLMKSTPLRRLVSEDMWDVYRLFEPYLLYFKGASARFNDEKTRTALQKHGVTRVKWQDYRDNILSYCVTTKFGKRRIQPEYEYYRYAVERCLAAAPKEKSEVVRTVDFAKGKKVLRQSSEAGVH